MEQALARVGAGAEAIGTLRAALGQPQPLSRLLGEVQQAGLAAHGYAAVLLAIGFIRKVAPRPIDDGPDDL